MELQILAEEAKIFFESLKTFSPGVFQWIWIYTLWPGHIQAFVVLRYKGKWEFMFWFAVMFCPICSVREKKHEWLLCALQGRLVINPSLARRSFPFSSKQIYGILSIGDLKTSCLNTHIPVHIC
jgi:hypothetical protein